MRFDVKQVRLYVLELQALGTIPLDTDLRGADFQTLLRKCTGNGKLSKKAVISLEVACRSYLLAPDPPGFEEFLKSLSRGRADDSCDLMAKPYLENFLATREELAILLVTLFNDRHFRKDERYVNVKLRWMRTMKRYDYGTTTAIHVGQHFKECRIDLNSYRITSARILVWVLSHEFCHAENFKFRDTTPPCRIKRHEVPRFDEPAVSTELRTQYGNRMFNAYVNIRNGYHNKLKIISNCDAEHDHAFLMSAKRFNRRFPYLTKVTVYVPTILS